MNRPELTEPSDAIRAARRSLEGHPQTKLVGDLLWYGKENLWAFAVDLTVDSADSSLVPATTRWFVLVDPRYPWGAVDIYPAKTNGLDKTFPHQDFNGEGDDQARWRDGDICIRASGVALGRSGDDPDPKGSTERITWYVSRAIEWLERASRNQLLCDGDEFELPQCKASNETVGFSEDPQSFEVWQRSEAAFGSVELVSLGSRHPIAARRFLNSDGKELLTPSWGRIIHDEKTPLLGAWIRLPSLPILPPYAAPMQWGELLAIMENAGLPPADVLQPALHPLRDGKPHILMVGFPIPRFVGQPPSVMHWQPLQLPALTHGKRPRNGFRATDKGYWLGDLVSSFGKHKPIQWLSGRNWNETQLGTRGRLSPPIREKTVLLLGAGAIGASMADLLVRGGVNRMVVIDDDSVSAGNLVRHSLALGDVGRAKAIRIAQRLNSLSPHADVTGLVAHFPRLSEADRRTIEGSDLILDCSGADDTLHALSEMHLPSSVHFVSVAMGRGARRLYVFGAHGNSFPLLAFQNALAPWLAKDADEFKDLAFPWEGIGCWHPVFPASADQVALFSATAVREVNQRIASGITDSTLVVFEDGLDTGSTTALRRESTHV